MASDRRDDSKFRKVSADSIDYRSLLANEQVPGSVQCRASYERGQRRIDVLEFLRIVDVFGSDPFKLLREIMSRGAAPKRPYRR